MFFPDNTTVIDAFFSDHSIPGHSDKKRFCVTDHGVAENSAEIQTAALQKVIDLAAEQGGGVVVIPAGKFFSGSLFFRPGCHLYLEEGAVLTGSDDISDFALIRDHRMEGENVCYFSALINAENCDNFTISGKGMLDGNGLRYWRSFWLRLKFNPKCTNMDEMRPRLLFVANSNNVCISGIKIHNSPFWSTHFYRCQKLRLLDLDIFAPSEPVPAPSSDAVDLDVCSDVLIRSCRMEVNDDAVALKGGKGPLAHTLPENGSNERIIIENCDFVNCHSALTCGSETVRNRNVIMRDCRIDRTPVFYLKMRPDTLQKSEYIAVSRITGNTRLFFHANSWTQFKRCEELLISCGENISFCDVDLDCRKICDAPDSKEFFLRNILWKNCTLRSEAPFECGPENLKSITLENVSMP